MSKTRSTSSTSDVLVVGLGGVGSAACYALASRGCRVIGIDQFDPPHRRGSSHGDSRIIRKSYFEHPSYVPLLIRAYELWRELETQTGKQLYLPTGLLEIGPADGVVLEGVKRSAREHSLPIEIMGMGEASSRYPSLCGQSHWQAVFERDAGYLLVEDCAATHLEQARRLGAEIRTCERMIRWNSDTAGVRVQTERETLWANKLILCAGPWASQTLASYSIPMKVVGKHLYWYPCRTDSYAQDRGFPCFFYDTPNGYFYGFPDHSGRGLKVARHSGGERIAGNIDGQHAPDDGDRALVEDFLGKYLPDVELNLSRWAGCYYTMTPDEHFVVDRLPAASNVVVVAGLSGHGFKFTSVLGQIASELALDGHSMLDIDFLSIHRFLGPNLKY
ncbi:MAG: N-methyl-L-tryptophan oxidase [Pirellula sp.]